MSFGVLTLATPDDYQKAIGLALSLRVSNPGVPLAVACSPKVRPKLLPYFDHIVDENPALRGFVHKVHLDLYSPFDETFFFDSDVLVFRALAEILDDWRGQPYAARGIYVSSGFSPFGLDRTRVLQKIGKDKLAMIDGAGHAYFKKPDCAQLFELAREITANYVEYAGNIRYADEDVIDIAMTMLDLRPYPYREFCSRYLSAKKGTLDMDASQGRCSFIEVSTSMRHRPHMMHFAANEAPFAYASQLKKIYKAYGVDTKGLLQGAISDFCVNEIIWPVKTAVSRVMQNATKRVI